MSVHQLRDGRWIVKIPDPEKKSGSRREYFGRGPGAEAKARARDGQINIRHTRPRDIDPGPKFDALTILYMEARHFNRKSRINYNNVLESFILPAIGNTPAMQLTYQDLSKYVSKRRQTVKDNTIFRELTIIQAIMNWAVRQKPALVPSNPLKGYEKPKPIDEIILPPTVSEIQAILSHSSERLKRTIYCTWYTGLRPGHAELFSLKWEMVDWDGQVIRIRSAQKGGILSREVPIHPKFYPILKSWYEKDGRDGWIIHYCGQPLRSGMNLAWLKAKKKAGITRRLRMYDIRHLFVTSAIEAGGDYKTLSEIVGSNPETLRKYYQHVSTAARQKLVCNIPELPGNF